MKNSYNPMNIAFYRTLILHLALLLLSCPSLFAQSNLVINSSFEEYNTCPLWDGGIYSGYCNYWNSPILGSTDYFNSCDLDYIADIPLNFAGFEYARTGKAYAGFVLYYYPSPSYREYVQGILYDTLKVGQSYIVKYYISLSDVYYMNKFCIDNIGVYISDSQLNYPTLPTNIPLFPTLQNRAGNWINNKIGWQRIEGVLTANGGEKFFTIGNFQNNTNTNKQDCFGLGVSNSDIYVYLDDVSIIDTSVIDTVNLCFDDSIQIGDLYAKSTGMYYDTVEDLIARTYVQMRPFSASYTEVDMPYHRGDTIKVGMREFCYSTVAQEPIIYCDSSDGSSCYRIQYLWATPDTFFDEKYSNSNGCDSTVRYFIRTNVGIHDPSSYKNGSVSIYPNPASNSIQVAYSLSSNTAVSKELNIEILDALGRNCSYKILGKTTNSSDIIFSIDITELSAGMYFTRILNKENRVIGNGRFTCR